MKITKFDESNIIIPNLKKDKKKYSRKIKHKSKNLILL
jgi:hypothetical protein